LNHRKSSSHRHRVRRWVALGASGASLSILSGCGVRVLDPAGPAAAAIANLWWVMFALSVIIFVGVMAALAVGIWGRRDGSEGRRERLGRHLVLIGGGLVPGVVILALMVYNTYVSVDLEEPPSEPALTVSVRSNQWWWHVHYPDHDITTANEIHIPAGRSVRLELTSDDVIHAFWVPELQGKRDMMPDHVGQLWLQADEPGTYRGQCAEFCGRQHAKMEFLVIAHEPGPFQAWLEERQAPRPDLTDEQAIRGKEVFSEVGCGNCHRVRGTDAAGELGPDLTNLASRRELGAGTLPNTREHLADWIVNAQAFKPGNLMPPVPMSDEDLQDLLAYLETLR
jgi:cytochrome c oxidase subunit 2